MAEKNMEDENRNKKQGESIENNNRYGRYQSKYIDNHFKHQWYNNNN